MKRIVSRFIDKHKLLDEGCKVIVALSGGADSVALLLLLKQLGYKCYAMHCNFHLRGEESTRDEEFARNLCQQKNIPLEVVPFDTIAYSKEKGISIEMAARELRYKVFEEYRTRIGAEAIAVGHHRNDNAETLLLNLMRGTGIRGLHGIRPKNGYIVRPLLCIGREDIMEFLHKEGATYVTDSTNLQADYTRNKVRLELLPAMQQINPSIQQTLSETAERIAATEEIYSAAIEQAIERIKENNTISIEGLKKEIAPTVLLHEILSPLGFNGAQIADIFDSIESNSGKLFISNGWRVIKDRSHLVIEQITEESFDKSELPSEGSIETPYGTLHISNEEYSGCIEKSRLSASLDADTLHTPLFVRKVKQGDRFIPFGMRGSKLISDYLTDRKLNILEKERQLVVTDCDDNILWLVGERPAAPYCVTEKTKKLLCLRWQRSQQL